MFLVRPLILYIFCRFGEIFHCFSVTDSIVEEDRIDYFPVIEAVRSPTIFLYLTVVYIIKRRAQGLDKVSFRSKFFRLITPIV